MDRTLNQLMRELSEIATAHRQIKEYFQGDYLDAVSRDAAQYPLMVATLQPGGLGDGFVQVNIIITIADKYNLQEYRQINEIHSDCLSICNDIKITMQQYRWTEFSDINFTISTDPFIQRSQDMTAGWSMNVSLNVFDDGNWCDLPMDDYDFENGTPTFSGDCQPATVSNSDDSFSREIPSGDSYTLDDVRIQVFNQNEELLSDAMYPAAISEQITVTIDDAHVQNSDDSYTQTLASGDTLQLPDITIEVVDQNANVLSSGTYPSVQDETISLYIAPCEDASYRITTEADVTLYEGTIESGGDLVQSINDSLVHNTNDSYLVNLPAEGNLELPDVTFSINNTLGTQVLSSQVPSVTNQTLIAPDGAVKLKHENDGTMAIVSTPSGVQTEYIIQNNDITVNAANPFILHAEEPLDIRLHNMAGNDITPSSVTYQGNQHYVTIKVNTAAFVPVGAKLMKTGQTTSYATGDDGATQRGRLTSFLTLASNNPFGNTNRFTNKTGGQTYTAGVALDWSTYDGSTVLAYYFGDANTRAWATQLTQYTGSTIDGLAGWNLFNIYEAMNIMNFSYPSSYLYNYAPFNLTRRYMWVSTNQTGASGVATETAAGSGAPFTASTKTSALWGIWTRVCTVTGTTIS